MSILKLNDSLMAQLERLNDTTLTGEQLQDEVNRAKAISDVTKNVLDLYNLQLNCVKYSYEFGYGKKPVILALEGVDSIEKTEIIDQIKQRREA